MRLRTVLISTQHQPGLDRVAEVPDRVAKVHQGAADRPSVAQLPPHRQALPRQVERVWTAHDPFEHAELDAGHGTG